MGGWGKIGGNGQPNGVRRHRLSPVQIYYYHVRTYYPYIKTPSPLSQFGGLCVSRYDLLCVGIRFIYTISVGNILPIIPTFISTLCLDILLYFFFTLSLLGAFWVYCAK